MDALDSYQWSGHKGAFAGQNENEVLQLFGNSKGISRKKYRSFIEDGISQGKRDELVGGGLRRSRKLSGSEEFDAYDERILGSGEFVERLQQETQLVVAAPRDVSMDEIIRRIASFYSIEPASLRQGGKRKNLSDARGAICYIAVIKLGMNGAAVARMLNVSRTGVSLAARRGEEIYEMTPQLHDIVVALQT